MRRGLLGLLLVLAGTGADLLAQTGAAAESRIGDAAAGERPGLFRLGTIYFTPYLQIGSLGIDTNVLYTETDRKTDFTASGGPGLQIVRPFGRESRVRIDGVLDYIYFAKTESQRKLNGYGKALLDIFGVNIEEPCQTASCSHSLAVPSPAQGVAWPNLCQSTR